MTNNIRWRAEIVGVESVETPEVPLEALREIIVNRFAHMKVSKSSVNVIYLKSSKIHIHNPGLIIPSINSKMFASGKQDSMIRNPLIAMFLLYNRTIEAFGTWFEQVFRLCKDISYQYNNNQIGFAFELFMESKCGNK